MVEFDENCPYINIFLFLSVFLTQTHPGAAVGGVVSTGMDLITTRDSEYIFTIIEIIAVLFISILTFGLRETKGRPLPEHVETMPEVIFLLD